MTKKKHGDFLFNLKKCFEKMTTYEICKVLLIVD